MLFNTLLPNPHKVWVLSVSPREEVTWEERNTGHKHSLSELGRHCPPCREQGSSFNKGSVHPTDLMFIELNLLFGGKHFFFLMTWIPYLSLEKAFYKLFKMFCNDEATHSSFSSFQSNWLWFTFDFFILYLKSLSSRINNAGLYFLSSTIIYRVREHL